MKWLLKTPEVIKSAADLEQVLFSTRHISNPAVFFQPTPPIDLTLAEVGIVDSQMAIALKLITQAIKKRRKIIVFGDYDADGITATSIMWLALNSLGAQAFPFIPDRRQHGYGLSERSLDAILEQGKPDLIITVDNGIVAHQAVDRVKAEGIEIIISDHHLPETDGDEMVYPAADAIIHSTQLCGASIAWILAREILTKIPHQSNQKQLQPNDFLDLAGIGTIADQVPLVGANRSFATFGLQALRTTKRVGLLALFESAGIQQAEIETNQVNFVITPRINAMGRLEHGLDALRLLCSQDKPHAQQRAKMLAETNSKRQDLTYEMVESAKQQAEQWQNEHLIFIASAQYHEGVIGLIAGKLVEEYSKPAIVASIAGDVIKASARSVAGVNIIELIRQVKDDLLEAGGHPMAAGFGLETAKLQIVTDRLKKLALTQIEAGLLEPKLEVDGLILLELVSLETCELLEKFAPFGQGNPQPIFGIQELTLLDAKTIGKEGQHLKLIVSNQNGEPLTCLAWNYGQLADQLQPGQKIDLAGSLQINRWHDRKSVQMIVKDLGG